VRLRARMLLADTRVHSLQCMPLSECVCARVCVRDCYTFYIMYVCVNMWLCECVYNMYDRVRVCMSEIVCVCMCVAVRVYHVCVCGVN
jgi:hypothetical protein